MGGESFTWMTGLIAIGLFLGMLAAMEIGYRAGMRRLAKHPETTRTGVGAIEGAVFGLLGLLLAFSFSGAASRFDARRQLIIQETNAIGTAYLRLDLLSPIRRVALQELFRQYVDARLEVYQEVRNAQTVRQRQAKFQELQKEIWLQAVANSQEHNYPPTTLLLAPSLNEMFDITTTRTMAAQIHPPTIIHIMLGILMLISALLAGVSMAGGKTRSWIHILGFSAILAITMFIILDLEYPRLGWIRVSDFDQALISLRQSMH
jgi:hypothetical protein